MGCRWSRMRSGRGSSRRASGEVLRGLYPAAMRFFENLVICAALVAAWATFRSPTRNDRSWVDWAGLIVAVVLILGELATATYGAALRRNTGPALWRVAGRLVGWIVPMILALALVPRLRPAWGRWIGMGFDEDRPPSAPREARLK